MAGWLADPNRGAVSRRIARALRFHPNPVVETLAAREFYGVVEVARVTWVRFDAPDPVAVSTTADLAATLGDVTAAATGSLSITADAAADLGNVTASATGNPEITAAASPTLGDVTAAAAASLSINADAAPVLGGVSLAATGTVVVELARVTWVQFAAPAAPAGVNAAATPTLGDVAAAATGSAGWTVPVGWDDITGEDGFRVKWGNASNTYTRSADVAADATSYDIGGLSAGTTYYARVYGLVAGVEQTGSAELVFTVGQPVADLAATLGSVTMAATGNPEITAAASPALGSVTLAADGTVVGAGSTADAAITLGDVTASATGSLSINGAATPTLSDVGLTAAATVSQPGVIAADLAAALGDVTAAASASLSITADAAPALADVGLAADGTVVGTGSTANAAITLGDVTASATGSLSINGAATPTLSDVGLAADASVLQPPAADVPTVFIARATGRRFATAAAGRDFTARGAVEISTARTWRAAA